MAVIGLSRVYDHDRPPRRPAFLVERLWPRGVRRADLHASGWLRDAAPSEELRRWFDHDPAKWDEFRRRYVTELEGRPEAWRPLVVAATDQPITLLYSSRDSEHNNAVALRAFLLSRLEPSPPPATG